MSLVCTVTPATEPVTDIVDFTKRSSADSSRLALNVKVAREFVENFTGRAIVSQTWRLTLPSFPAGGKIELPRTPLATVTSVKYYPADLGAQATLSASLYNVITSEEPGCVFLKTGQDWPDTDTRPDAVEVVFTAGYATASLIPESLLQAIRVIAADEADFATRYITGTILTPVPERIESLLLPHKVGGII